MTDKSVTFESVIRAMHEEDKNQFSEGLEVLSESLSRPQAYIFDWICKEMAREKLNREKIIIDLKRQIEELQKELTFKGVPDDGC